MKQLSDYTIKVAVQTNLHLPMPEVYLPIQQVPTLTHDTLQVYVLCHWQLATPTESEFAEFVIYLYALELEGFSVKIYITSKQ